jgi:hypothetical protein
MSFVLSPLGKGEPVTHPIQTISNAPRSVLLSMDSDETSLGLSMQKM